MATYGPSMWGGPMLGESVRRRRPIWGSLADTIASLIGRDEEEETPSLLPAHRQPPDLLKTHYEFDPESGEYDYQAALAAGLGPDETGHWPSREPDTGMLLKGASHPTFQEGVSVDEGLGYGLVKKPNGRYYTERQGPSLAETIRSLGEDRSDLIHGPQSPDLISPHVSDAAAGARPEDVLAPQPQTPWERLILNPTSQALAKTPGMLTDAALFASQLTNRDVEAADVLRRDVTDPLLAPIEEAARAVEPERGHNILERTLQTAIGTAPQLFSTVASGSMAPLTAFAMAGSQSEREARERGLDPGLATLKGITSGALTAPLEALGAGAIRNLLKGATAGGAKEIAQRLLAEPTTEITQEGMEILLEAVTGKEFAQGEIVERMTLAPLAAAALTGAAGASGMAARRLAKARADADVREQAKIELKAAHWTPEQKQDILWAAQPNTEIYYRGDRSTDPERGEGIYLSAKPEVASVYAAAEEGSNVSRWAVRGNLLDLRGKDADLISGAIPKLREAGLSSQDLAEINDALAESGRITPTRGAGTPEGDLAALSLGIGGSQQLDMEGESTYHIFRDKARDVTRRKLMDLGYDGVKFDEGDQDNVYVFDRTKSAREVSFGLTPGEVELAGPPKVGQPEWMKGEEGAVRLNLAQDRPRPKKLPPNLQQEVDEFQSRAFGERAKPPSQTPGERVQGVLDAAYDTAFNAEQGPVRRVKRTIGREQAERVDDLIRMNRAAHGVSTGPLFYETRVLSDTSGPVREAYALLGETLPEDRSGNFIRTGESAAEIFHGWDEDFKLDMRNYMAAKRQIEKAELVASGQSTVEIDPDMTARARRAVNALERKHAGADIDQLAQRVTDWSRRATLDPLLEVGVLTPQDYAQIVDKNRRYVPFYRLEEISERVDDILAQEGMAPAPARSPKVKKLTKGLTPEDKLDPEVFESLVSRAQAVQKFVARQRLRNELARLAESDPALGLDIRKDPRGTRTIKVGDEYTSIMSDKRPDNFVVYKDGKAQLWEAPPDVIRALEPWDIRQLNLLFKVLNYPAKMLRAGATLGLDFMFRNFLRDPQTAFIYDPNAKIKGVLTGEPFIAPMRGLYQVLTHGADFEAAIASGVGDSVLVAADRPNAEALLQDVMSAKMTKEGNAHARFLKRWKHETLGSDMRLRDVLSWGGAKQVMSQGRPLQAILSPLQTISGSLEMATRVSVYQRAKKAGKSDLEAMRAARESTLDFSRAGLLGRQLNALQAFANAELQDIDKFARAIKERPMETMMKAGALITLPSLANWLMWHDDEEYRELPEWRKIAFYTVAKRPGGGFVHFPRPLGTLNLLFGYLPEKLMDYAFDKDPQVARRLHEMLVEQTPARLLPIPGPDDDLVGTLGRTMSEWMPTAATPLVEAETNTDISFQRGKPIVPQGLERKANPEEFFEYTPQAYRELGQKTGSSPIMLQHIAEGYGAYVARYIAQLAELGYDALGRSPPRNLAPKTLKDYPVVGGILSREPIGSGSESVGRFYELLDRFKEEKASANDKYGLSGLNKKGMIYRVQLHNAQLEYPMLKHIEEYEKGEKHLRELRALRREAMEKGNWDRVKAIDRQMTATAQQYLPAEEKRPR